MVNLVDSSFYISIQIIIQFIFPGTTDSNIIYQRHWNLCLKITCCFHKNLRFLVLENWEKLLEKSMKSPGIFWEAGVRTLIRVIMPKFIQIAVNCMWNCSFVSFHLSLFQGSPVPLWSQTHGEFTACDFVLTLREQGWYYFTRKFRKFNADLLVW